MNRWIVATICVVLLGACGGEMPPTTDASGNSSQSAGPESVDTETSPAAVAATRARFDGYGATRFGMDEEAFRTAWNGDLDGPPASARGTCYYLWPATVEVPADFAFMFEHGRFVRYDVGNAERTAPGGGKVGMPAQEIRSRYPGLTEKSHKYVTGGHYFRVTHPSGNDALVFEIDAEGMVTSWRIGVPPQVDYVEGCS